MLRFPLSDAAELAYVPSTRAAYVLSAREAALLDSCAARRPLSAHAQFAPADGANANGHDTRDLLLALASRGLLVSDEELVRRAIPASTESPTPGISCIVIPTCDRRMQLERAVRTFADNALAFDHEPVFLIADDSRAADAQQAVAQTLRAVTTTAPVTLRYLGREQRRAFAAALCADGSIPDDIVAFALFGPGGAAETIGANRNAILLETVGSMALSTDDDTVCETGLFPNLSPHGLRLGGHGDLSEARFFADRESARQHVGAQRIDVMAEHNRLLGRSLSSIVREAHAADACDLGGMCGHFVDALATNKGHIGLTVTGLAGDAGTHNNMWIRLCAGAATARRVSTETAYRDALSSREITRQVPVDTISHVFPFISTSFGLDNRQLLPPFFPAYRNDEGIFALVLSRCMDHVYAGHLPWTLLHAPAESRAYPTENPLATVRVSDLLLACITYCTGAPPASPTADKLRALGRYLIELGTLAQDDFDETMRVLLWQRASEVMTGMDYQIRRLAAADRQYWAADLETHLRGFERAVLQADYILPVDLLACYPASDVPRLSRALVRHYGELLVWWPAIVERARTLAAEGRGPANPLS